MGNKRGADSQIVAGIVSGLNRADVAVQAGVSERTLRRRLKDPEVIQGIAEARVHVHGEVMGRLQRLASKAIDEIEKVLDNGTDTGRLAAAKLTLDQIVSHRAALDDARVAAVEVAQAQFDARIEALR